MPARARRPCTITGCPNPTRSGRCEQHTKRRQREQDSRRLNARQRGYDHRHEHHFRRTVLARDPWCTCPGCPSCHPTDGPCLRDATDADHYPLSRRELETRGLDPNDPRHGRGLCRPCHSHATAHHQPGGWHQR